MLGEDDFGDGDELYLPAELQPLLHAANLYNEQTTRFGLGVGLESANPNPKP